MNFASSATPEFWDMYRKLPAAVRNLARKTYLLWSREAFHPSLHFKKVRQFWSARVGTYRILYTIEGPEASRRVVGRSIRHRAVAYGRSRRRGR